MPEAMVKFALDTARDAGGIVRGHFGAVRSGTAKTQPGDIVTHADLEAESLIVTRIREAYPDHSILAEESGLHSIPEGEYTWVIDPLDGTKNFTQHIPFFCVSIAVVRDGCPVVGVVYDPIHDEAFYAVEGAGAYLNGKPIRVSSQHDLRLMVINLAWARNMVGDLDFGQCAIKVVEHTHYFRRLGAAALVAAYIADGRMDAAANLDLKPWDMAAGMLLIQEAGGVVSDLFGNPLDILSPNLDIVAANPLLHEKLIREILCS